MEYDAEEQYQTLIRAFREAKALEIQLTKRSVVMKNVVHEEAVIFDDTIKDKMRTFFIECYHFKDWLKKDSRVTLDVETFISGSRELSIAADLCNSLKHAGLDRKPRSTEPLSSINVHYVLEMPKGKSFLLKFNKNPKDGDKISFNYIPSNGTFRTINHVLLTLGGKEHSALRVAEQCLTEWRKFIALNGLKFEEPPTQY